MRIKVVKKYYALVKHLSDGGLRIEPVIEGDAASLVDINERIKEDKKRRVPRAEAFLRSLNLHTPGVKVPDRLTLLRLGAESEVYAGPMREAALQLNMLHVVQVLDEEES
jgi:hypothetical protein